MKIKLPSGLKKHIPNKLNGKKATFAIGAVLALVLLLAGTFLFINNDDVNNNEQQAQKTPVNQDQIIQLAQKSNCDNGLAQLSDANPDTENDPQGSLILLGYRAGCYTEKREYQKSLEDYQIIKEIMKKTEDPNIKSIEFEIKKLEGYINNPSSAPKQKTPNKEEFNQLSPELKAELESTGDNE